MIVRAAGVPENGVKLSDLMRELRGGCTLRGDGETRVFGVHHDSRKVEPGDLFVARTGGKTAGSAFVGQARDRGAVAVLAARSEAEKLEGETLPLIVADDVADAFAYAAAAIHGHPSFTLDVIGITGTNGKTTTTHLVRDAIDAAEGASKCGLVGTVGHSFGDFVVDAEHTTPEADELARVMAEMRSRGATYVAMEVSSIALDLGRVRAVRFRTAAITNFTQDHLDFHGSMAAYAAAKKKLFRECAPGSVVANISDSLGIAIADDPRAPLVRVSAIPGQNADVVPVDLKIDAAGIKATFATPKGEARIESRLFGAHNVENMAVALGVIVALDLDVRKAAAGLSAAAGPPGRLERCDAEGDDVTVLVDYAHTPDALVRSLESVRAICKGRVLCVFGCGGDRDTTKRRPMGEAVAKNAAVAILTNDNPRTEDPEKIAAEVISGLEAGGMQRGPNGFTVELDRARAIRLAIEIARPGDAILVAGKGHETYQIVGSEKRSFDDRVEARDALVLRREIGKR
ncbi:MAG TPA: UDP-N-acetylmuramoyl-L-alanyl-D-glutamate--2,6-diaminopimelate ligase [Polyangiaceae bacterium]